MSLQEYLNHLKEKEDKEQNEESINSDSTLDEMIDEKLRIFEKLIKDDKGLKFKKGIKGGALSQKNKIAFIIIIIYGIKQLNLNLNFKILKFSY